MRLSIIIITFLLFNKNGISQELVPFRIGEKWGYSNYAGNLIIKAKYDSVGLHNRNGFIDKIAAKIYKKDRQGLIDHFGKVLIKPRKWNEIENMGYWFDGIDYLIVRKKNAYGVIDENGKITIPVIYDELKVYEFSEVKKNVFRITGYAFLAKKNSKHFLIYPNGNIDEIGIEEYNKKKGTEYGILIGESKKSNPLNISNDLDRIIKKNKDKTDSISLVINHKSTEFAKSYFNGKVGLVKKSEILKGTFRYTIVPQYDSILDVGFDFFTNKPNKFLVKNQNKIAVIDTRGNLLMPFKYEDYKSWNRNYIILKSNELFGYFHFEDKIEIEPKYADIRPFRTVFKIKSRYKEVDLWQIMKNGQWGYINEKGKEYFKN